MADKGPTVSAKQLAMSRALGAAFLTHQVEQLEKSVNARGGPGSANWRETQRTIMPQKRFQNSRSPAMLAKMKPRDVQDDNDAKEADIIVVDASVLVHALYQVKRWCKDGRDQVLIVPLEALNTLDLLKKGTSSLAQRARAASRILEAQVGTNPRVRVQRDEAFVFWDKITFTTNDTGTPLPSPEWVRRTVCCAKWETENPLIELGTDGSPKPTPRVVFAVLSPSSDGDQATNMPVVPLPAPSNNPNINKFEPRSTGTLVSYWASKAGVEILEIDAAAPGHGRGPGSGEGDEEETVGPRTGRRGHSHHGHGYHGHARGGRRKPSISSIGDNASSTITGTGGNGPGLVERPPAVMAMMEMVSQPSKVVRVLARGEKLDP